MKVTFLKIAATELDDAFEYYESVQNGLGFRFLTEVELSKARIQNFPFLYKEIGRYSRRCLVHRFPYGIIYQYMEQRRNPNCGCFSFTSLTRLLVR
ncbi:hypothetical protein AU255_12410 [Methyloprofundus sedimenti]|uniref:Plasmid stabilization protein n=1 Tax=Methyloprofundus sedimenti TaxID=1420851 RepID=A0A1V8MAM1_9GAMM|nr:hypothetical protein AU255_12410 [Methyloprofundus sedimenti]